MSSRSLGLSVPTSRTVTLTRYQLRLEIVAAATRDWLQKRETIRNQLQVGFKILTCGEAVLWVEAGARDVKRDLRTKA